MVMNLRRASVLFAVGLAVLWRLTRMSAGSIIGMGGTEMITNVSPTWAWVEYTFCDRCDIVGVTYLKLKRAGVAHHAILFLLDLYVIRSVDGEVRRREAANVC